MDFANPVPFTSHEFWPNISICLTSSSPSFVQKDAGVWYPQLKSSFPNYTHLSWETKDVTTLSNTFLLVLKVIILSKGNQAICPNVQEHAFIPASKGYQLDYHSIFDLDRIANLLLKTQLVELQIDSQLSFTLKARNTQLRTLKLVLCKVSSLPKDGDNIFALISHQRTNLNAIPKLIIASYADCLGKVAFWHNAFQQNA